MLDDIHVPARWSRALAAALGDDLLVARERGEGAFWRELSHRSPDPQWPDGVVPLSAHFDVPPRLAARLAAVGVCADAETAARFQPELGRGERLVTAEGGLWRWDGLVRPVGEDDPQARRVLQRHRLLELESEITEHRRFAATAAAEVEKSTAMRARCEAEVEDLAQRLRSAETAIGEARLRNQRLAQLLETSRVTAGRLDEEIATLRREDAELRAERAPLVEDGNGGLDALEAEFLQANLSVDALEAELASSREALVSR